MLARLHLAAIIYLLTRSGNMAQESDQRAKKQIKYHS